VVPEADAYFTGAVSVEGTVVAGVLRAPAADFSGASCAVLVTHDTGNVSTLAWSGGPAALVRLAEGAGLIRAAFAGSAIACQPEVCGDELDNDGDGEADDGCQEVCGDAIDNNSNGKVDEGCAEICGDGEDNDQNGTADDGCAEICGDGVDNDGDDLVDAPCAEICDGIDNDINGTVDDDCPPRPVDAGCPPDRWLSEAARPYWRGLKPEQSIGSAFAMPSTEPYLALAKEAVQSILSAPPARQASESDARGLLRVATAALLNASHEAAGYPIAPAVVVEQVNGALDSGNPVRVWALAAVLDAYNRLGCRLPEPARERH